LIPRSSHHAPGLIVLFGSGEVSPTGRKIHDAVFKRLGFTAGVKIGILETPSGFETNAIHGWPERLENFFRTKLKNYKPDITRIHAWAKKGEHSTNDPDVVDAILRQDYLYCGAGSPSYTVNHLVGSRAYTNLQTAFTAGATLCLGSASAIAVGRYALPVYEIFKVGEDIHWIDGLNLFSAWDLNLVIIPHWNNQEGQDFDTTRCFMGKERFSALEKLLPEETIIVGIDEETACVITVGQKKMDVVGVGAAHIRKNGQEVRIAAGSSFQIQDVA
jgi:hypothetical protein